MSQVDRELMDVENHYEHFVPMENKYAMLALVHLVLDFKEDVEVEHQFGGVIHDLGCSRTRNSKFYHTLELY
jgi:hypothetical protein